MKPADQINRIADEAIKAIEQVRNQATARPNLEEPVVVAGIKWGGYLTPSERRTEQYKYNDETGLYYFDQESAVLHAYEQNLRLPTNKQHQQLYDRTTHRNETICGMAYKVFTDKETGEELWFPFAGFYDFEDGLFYFVGRGGYGWSGSVSTASFGFYLYFSIGSVNPQVTNYRSYGFPVRCVSE